MNDNQAKFQSLLRELFQFDCADLDFGIYRIMNHNRAVIERFITADLPQAITEELERGALAEQAQAAQALEAAVYNHLYTFFNRYWQDGDFISKRRYSKKERYAIPYNGEEVYLYWANHDQYYIKTGEYFTDYTYKAPNGVTVHFKLRQAYVEQNNVKGEKRFFLPRLDEITWDKATRQVVIPFEYRPLTAQEAITYGQKNQQEAIIAKAVAEIPKHPGNADVSSALGNADVSSALEHHLRQYTRRNTSDFFIHKDLKGFLARELDFYLKNEVLNLDEMEAAGEGLSEGWFQLLRLIKRIGLRIIEFLAQIEDFQKMLWEKKKFVTEVFYLVTVGHVPEVFYPEIAACEAQWDEWKQLGIPIPGIADVSSAKNENVIPGIADVSSAGNAIGTPASSEKNLHKGWHTRGYLPHFDAGNILQFITFRLADSVPSEVIDQWKQELRWHEGMDAASKEAVELRKRIEKYEDSGKGACYLRDERIARLVEDALKRFNGERYRLIAWCIMPNHVHVLIKMMDAPLPDIVKEWKSYTAHAANKILGRSGTFWMPDYFDRYIRDEEHFRTTVDYIFQNPVQAGLVDAPEKWAWSGFIPENAGNASVSDADSAALTASGARAGGRDVRDPRNPRIQFLKSHPTLVLDTRHFPQDFTDRLLASFDNLDEVTDGLLVHSENWQALNLLQEKYRERVKCIHIDPPYNTQTSGFLYKNDYQHSSWLAMMENRVRISQTLLAHDGHFLSHIDENEYERLKILFDNVGIPDAGTVIWDKRNPMTARRGVATQHEYIVGASSERSDLILDFFAGSGTTGHAVINLNREDGGRRKFILVEMADYFDTVLLPRIKKVTFTPEWKDGKPGRMTTAEEAERSPRLVKVIRLESYEDALNNLTFEEQSGQQALDLFRDDYLLSYMLRWETRHSETLLNVEQLQSPFSYKLHLHRDGEIRERTVDLPETFNYLLGLDVQRRKVYINAGGTPAIPGERYAGSAGVSLAQCPGNAGVSPAQCPGNAGVSPAQYLVYRGRLRNGRTVVILWRDITGWGVKDYEREAAFVAQQKLTAGADEIYVNGDSRIPGARSLDPIFKERMFATMEA